MNFCRWHESSPLSVAFSRLAECGHVFHVSLRSTGRQFCRVRVPQVIAYLAGAVLAGLVLNAAVGWWWADPLAGFVIVFYGLKEGWAAVQHAS